MKALPETDMTDTPQPALATRMRRLAIQAAWALVAFLCIESAYRIYMHTRFPERFAEPAPDHTFVVYDRSQWEFDRDFGYRYIPESRMAGARVTEGRVTGCFVEGDANRQGNIGPAVGDYDAAEVKVLVFGDSFSATAIDGKTWVSLLQDELSKASGRRVRVMNLARDGYGVFQMFDLAASRIPAMKPDVVVFAFNTTALMRGRTWRTHMGTGEDVRFVTTTQPSQEPEPGFRSDMLLLHPAATREWCATLPASNDPLLQRIVGKRARIQREMADRKPADVYDFSVSYVANLLLHNDPLHAWRNIRPGINYLLKNDAFDEDVRFRQSLDAVTGAGVPWRVVHLPLCVTLKDGKEFAFPANSEKLMRRFEERTGHRLLPLKDSMNVAPADAMTICRSAEDVHPSESGMGVYARAVAKVLAGEFPEKLGPVTPASR